MRWYEVQSDMRVDWCSAADAAVAATARSAGDRTAVTSGPDELGGREVGVSKRSQGRDFTPERRSAHIVGFRPPPRTSRAVRTGVMPLTMVLPELGGREVGVSKRSQGRDFTPERRSAHIVGFRPPPRTSRAVRTGVMPLTMVLPELGGREVGVSKRSQGRDFTPERRSAHIVGFRPPPRTSRAVRTGVMPLTIDQPTVGVNRGQRCRFSVAAARAISSCAAAQAQPDAAHSRATYHLIPSGAAA